MRLHEYNDWTCTNKPNIFSGYVDVITLLRSTLHLFMRTCAHYITLMSYFFNCYKGHSIIVNAFPAATLQCIIQSWSVYNTFIIARFANDAANHNAVINKTTYRKWARTTTITSIQPTNFINVNVCLIESYSNEISTAVGSHRRLFRLESEKNGTNVW